MDNSSIDKLAEQYASDDSDAKVFQKAQQSTIISQTKQINESRRKIEELSKELEQLTIENTRLRAMNPSEQLETEDAETIALVQLALLRNYAMQRELTLEECKKSEIYVKILKEVRNKSEESKDSVSSMSTEQLLAALKES